MKSYVTFIAMLLLNFQVGRAQSVKEVSFRAAGSKQATNEGLVDISIKIDTNQRISPNGISFAVILKNKTARAICVQNVVEYSILNLSNSLGFNVAVTNLRFTTSIDFDHVKKWKVQSDSVSLGNTYINENSIGDISEQRFIDIPARGTCRIELNIKNVQPIESAEDLDKILSKVPPVPAIYKLRMISQIYYVTNEQDKSTSLAASYRSPRITINYGKNQ